MFCSDKCSEVRDESVQNNLDTVPMDEVVSKEIVSDEVADAVAAASDEISDILKEELGDTDRAERIGAELADLSAELGMIAGLEADADTKKEALYSIFDIALARAEMSRGSISGSSTSSSYSGRKQRTRPPKPRRLQHSEQVKRNGSTEISDEGATGDEREWNADNELGSGTSDTSSVKEAELGQSMSELQSCMEQPVMGQFVLPLIAPELGDVQRGVQHLRTITQLLNERDETVELSNDEPFTRVDYTRFSSDEEAAARYIRDDTESVSPVEEVMLLNFLCESWSRNECPIVWPSGHQLAMSHTLRVSEAANFIRTWKCNGWSEYCVLSCDCRLCVALVINLSNVVYSIVRSLANEEGSTKDAVVLLQCLALNMSQQSDCLANFNQWSLDNIKLSEKGAKLIGDTLLSCGELATVVCCCNQRPVQHLNDHWAVDALVCMLQRYREAVNFPYQVEFLGPEGQVKRFRRSHHSIALNDITEKGITLDPKWIYKCECSTKQYVNCIKHILSEYESKGTSMDNNEKRSTSGSCEVSCDDAAAGGECAQPHSDGGSDGSWTSSSMCGEWKQEKTLNKLVKSLASIEKQIDKLMAADPDRVNRDISSEVERRFLALYTKLPVLSQRRLAALSGNKDSYCNKLRVWVEDQFGAQGDGVVEDMRRGRHVRHAGSGRRHRKMAVRRTRPRLRPRCYPTGRSIKANCGDERVDEAPPPETFVYEGSEQNPSDTDTVVGERDMEFCKEMKDCLNRFASFVLNTPDSGEVNDAHDRQVLTENQSPPLQTGNGTQPVVPNQRCQAVVELMNSTTAIQDKLKVEIINVNHRMMKDCKDLDALTVEEDRTSVVMNQLLNGISNIKEELQKINSLPDDGSGTKLEVSLSLAPVVGEQKPYRFSYYSFEKEVKKAIDECGTIISSCNSFLSKGHGGARAQETAIETDAKDDLVLSIDQIYEAIMSLDESSTSILENLSVDANLDEISFEPDSKIAEMVQNLPQMLANIPEIASKLSEFGGNSSELPEFASIISDLNSESQLTPETIRQIKELKLCKHRDGISKKRKVPRKAKIEEIVEDVQQTPEKPPEVEETKEEETIIPDPPPEEAKSPKNTEWIFQPFLTDKFIKECDTYSKISHSTAEYLRQWRRMVLKETSIPVDVLDSELQYMMDTFQDYIETITEKHFHFGTGRVLDKLQFAYEEQLPKIMDPKRLLSKLMPAKADGRGDPEGQEHDLVPEMPQSTEFKKMVSYINRSVGDSYDRILLQASKMSQQERSNIKNLRLNYLDIAWRYADSQELAKFAYDTPEEAVRSLARVCGLPYVAKKLPSEYESMSTSLRINYVMNRFRELSKLYVTCLPKVLFTIDEWCVMLYRLMKLELRIEEAILTAVDFKKNDSKECVGNENAGDYLLAKGLSMMINKGKGSGQPKRKEQTAPMSDQQNNTNNLRLKNEDCVFMDHLKDKCESVLGPQLLAKYREMRSFIESGAPISEEYKNHVREVCLNIREQLAGEEIQDSEVLARHTYMALRDAKQPPSETAATAEKKLEPAAQKAAPGQQQAVQPGPCPGECVCHQCNVRTLNKDCKSAQAKSKPKQQPAVKTETTAAQPAAQQQSSQQQQHVCKVGHNPNACGDCRNGDPPCNCCYCTVFGHAPPQTTPVPKNYNETRERLRSILNKKKQKYKNEQEEETQSSKPSTPIQALEQHKHNNQSVLKQPLVKPTAQGKPRVQQTAIAGKNQQIEILQQITIKYPNGQQPGSQQAQVGNIMMQANVQKPVQAAQKQMNSVQQKPLQTNTSKSNVQQQAKTLQSNAQPIPNAAAAAAQTQHCYSGQPPAKIAPTLQVKLSHNPQQRVVQGNVTQNNVSNGQKPSVQPSVQARGLVIQNKHAQCSPVHQQQQVKQPAKPPPTAVLHKDTLAEKMAALSVTQNVGQVNLTQQSTAAAVSRQYNGRQISRGMSLESSRDSSIDSTSSGCSGRWAEDPRSLDALLQYIEGPARPTKAKKKAKKARQRVKKIEGRLMEQHKELYNAKMYHSGVLGGRRLIADQLKAELEEAKENMKKAKQNFNSTKKGKKSKVSPSNKVTLQTMAEKAGELMAQLKSANMMVNKAEKDLKEIQEQYSKCEKQLEEARAFLAQDDQQSFIPEPIIMPDEIQSTKQELMMKMQYWQTEAVQSDGQAAGNKQKVEAHEQFNAQRKERTDKRDNSKAKKELEKPADAFSKVVRCKEEKVPAERDEHEELDRKKKPKKGKENKVTNNSAPGKQAQVKPSTPAPPVGCGKGTKVGCKENSKKPAAVSGAKGDDGCSIMHQLSCGVQVGDLKLPPGITLTRVASQRQPINIPAPKTLPTWKGNQPTPPQPPPAVLLVSAPEPPKAMPQTEQSQSAGKSKKAKKKAKKAAASTNGGAAQPNPNKPIVETKKAADGTKMVTLRNPMFHSNLQPVVQAGAGQGNQKKENIRIPDPIPMPRNACQATITPTSNGMYTIRNPLMSMVHQQGLMRAQGSGAAQVNPVMVSPQNPQMQYAQAYVVSQAAAASSGPAYVIEDKPEAKKPLNMVNLASFQPRKSDEGYSLFKSPEEVGLSYQQMSEGPGYQNAFPSSMSPNPIGTKPDKFEQTDKSLFANRPEPIGTPVTRKVEEEQPSQQHQPSQYNGGLYTPFGATSEERDFRSALFNHESPDKLGYFERLRAGSARLNSEVTIHRIVDGGGHYKDQQHEMNGQQQSCNQQESGLMSAMFRTSYPNNTWSPGFVPSAGNTSTAAANTGLYGFGMYDQPDDMKSYAKQECELVGGYGAIGSRNGLNLYYPEPSVFVPDQTIKNLNELENSDRDIESFKRFEYFFKPPKNKPKVDLNIQDLAMNLCAKKDSK